MGKGEVPIVFWWGNLKKRINFLDYTEIET